MSQRTFLFTSESVTEGHPDKVADQISDAILDALLEKDKNSRVACETFVTTGLVLVGGEITTNSYVDIPTIARNTVKKIGYANTEQSGFDGDTCSVLTTIDKQSPDIRIGVDRDGAGDQGLMFGYATDENEDFMPTPINLAHQLCYRLATVRKNEALPFLLPDGKAQVTVRYENGIPIAVETVVVSTQHTADVSQKQIKEAVIEEIIKPVIPANLLSGNVTYHINPTGRFVIGGPVADTGLTGRKIIVDTYGGWGRHGGGAFSGKDPSKVDRSASYMARYIAKNIVAAGLAKRCELQLAYAIGVKKPVSLYINTFGTATVPEPHIEAVVFELLDLTPRGIINTLDLLRPIYLPTAAYGHFGRDDFAWEKTDLVEPLRSKLL